MVCVCVCAFARGQNACRTEKNKERTLSPSHLFYCLYITMLATILFLLLFIYCKNKKME